MKWSDQKSVPQTVRISGIDFLDRYDGIASLINQKGNKLSAYFFGEKFEIGETVEVDFFSSFSQLDNWQKTFSQNRRNEIKLDQTEKVGSYNGYAKILSINPIMVDFGDVILDIGNWTNDERVIGEFIYWPIERLEVARH